MYIGRKPRALILAIVLCFVGCKNTDKKAQADQTIKSDAFILQDVNSALSGIWYHTQKANPYSRQMERRFSWGVSTFSYQTALCIDLLDGQQYIGFESWGYDRISVETNPKNQNIVYLHLRQSNSPAKDEAKINFIDSGVMTFEFMGGVNTTDTRLINGTFYKVLDPSKLDKAP